MTDTVETVEEIDLSTLAPIRYGPTWQRGEDGKFILPEYTLGWEVIGWIRSWLLDEEGGPFTPTREQARFLLWWYAVDERGRFIYRRGVLQRLKGWGKDPLAAVMCLVELVGPCRFSHWEWDEAAGKNAPVAKPQPFAWVQLLAVNVDQTRNTSKFFEIMMSADFRAAYNIENGQGFVRAHGGSSEIQALTSSPRGMEGKRPTFAILNETHHWVVGNGGKKMAETLDGNAVKSKGGTARYLSITNAYLPGEESVAEAQREAYEAILDGRAVDTGFLYDTIEAHPKTPLTPEALEVVLPTIRGDAEWLDIEAITASILQADISPARSRRMWLNQVVADADSLLETSDWDDLSIGYEGETLKDGDEIVLGFDGGRTDDATALVAVRVRDGFAQLLHLQECPRDWSSEGKWEVDRGKVDKAVRDAHSRYKVRAMFADPALWESNLADWGEQYGHLMKAKGSPKNALIWDMRDMRRATKAHEVALELILAGDLAHGGVSGARSNRDLRRHVLNARRRENKYGVSFGKSTPESPHKVDAYAALILAITARQEVRQLKKEPGRSNRGWFF